MHQCTWIPVRRLDEDVAPATNARTCTTALIQFEDPNAFNVLTTLDICVTLCHWSTLIDCIHSLIHLSMCGLSGGWVIGWMMDDWMVG